MKILLVLAVLVGNACRAIRVDPDTLPSIEVLLVPPKDPYPQVRAELIRIHQLREAVEKKYEEEIINAYIAQVEILRKAVPDMIEPITSPLQESGIPGSLLEGWSSSHNVENLAISVAAMPEVGMKVKDTILSMEEKRAGDERLQMEQALKEFPETTKLITEALKASLSKYFSSSGNRALLQQAERTDQSGIKQVLNVRVGSSDSGDGLSDGASFPSVLGMVEEENESRDAGELTLLNSILFHSRRLGVEALKLIETSLNPHDLRPSYLQLPGFRGDAMSSSTKLLPPAFPRILRKKAFEHSTVQLDMIPPAMDDWSTVDQLNAVLQSEVALKKSRLSAYITVKKRLMNDIVTDIGTAVRTAAIRWGLITDPSTVKI